jgi:Kdo2-lipid IVA lauroyltransferase/acyltransferase
MAACEWGVGRQGMTPAAELGYEAAMVTLSEPQTRSSPKKSWYRIEGAAVGMFFGLSRMLPLDLASGLGGWLARRIGPALGVTAQARRNLAAALPDLSAAEIERVIRGMWDNLGRVAAEYPHLRRIRVFPNDGRVEIRGLDHVERALAGGRRMILFSGHLANWEIAPLAAGQYGLDNALVYRTANNPLVDRMILRCRGGRGEVIPKEAVGRRAVAALRRGAHLLILADQKLNEGIPAPFFGRPAMTAPTVALLGLRFDCDVLPARVERLGGARFRLTIEPPLPPPNTGNRAADVAALTASVNTTLERWIRERPEQWFWVHRRWPDPAPSHDAPSRGDDS